MKKLILSSLVALTAIGAAARHMGVEVDKSHDLWWNAPERPVLNLSLSDTTGGNASAELRVWLTPDTLRDVAVFDTVCAVQLPASVSINLPVDKPGFYRCHIADDGNMVKEVVVGYEPTNVVSLPDARADFHEFWARAKAELAAVPDDFTLELLPEMCGEKRDMYLCTYRSLGGDTIKAWVAIPKAPGTYPAQVYFNGYGGKPWRLDPDGRPDWIEMATSVRGQYLSEEGNRYGDWIRYHLNDPDTYYYKGAYMDAVRGVEVLAKLPGADPDHLFAEGGSQGGALTLVAAALSDGRLRAIAPYIPFMSDFPDYFRIVDWPASAVKAAAAEQGLSDGQMYENLTYFDIKNFARLIKCPVLMGIGLQDPVCPPHTNLSGYNLIESPKELRIYPECGHTVDYSDWNPRRDAFFARWW